MSPPIRLSRLFRFALYAVVGLGLTIAAREAVAADAEPAEVGSASSLYEKALVEYNLGRARTAYIHLKNALLVDPFLLPAHLLLGKIYLQLGEGEKAEKEILIADGLGAHQSLTLIPLARAYLLQGKAERLIAELFPLGTLPEEDAELLALRGEAHLQLEQLYDAQRAFSQAWERNPNNVGAILGRIHVLLLQGELSEADFYARRAVELAPGHPRAWYLKGLLARSLGDISAALRDFERAAEVMPAHLPAQLARVSALLDLGRLDSALALAREVREIYPQDPRTAYLQALVHARRQDVPAAEESLKAAQALLSRLPRELIEGHPPTLLLAGMTGFSLKQWRQAEEWLSLYLKRFPDTVGPRTLLAQIRLDQGQIEEAIKLLETAAALAPGDEKVLSLLAEAFLREDHHIKAAQYLQQAVEADRDNLVLRTQRAVNAFGLGRKAQALEDLGAALDASPDLPQAGATLTVMALKERRYAEAVVAARRLATDYPGNLTYLNLYGVAETAAGDLEAARWAFDLALALDWSFTPAELNLAELDLREGRPEAARERLLALLERTPRQVSAMMLLARALEDLDDPERAREWAERAVGVDPGSVPVAVYLTNLLLRMKRSEDALEVAEAIEVRAPDSDDLDLLKALSRAYIANGRRATAQVVLQRGSSLAGYDAQTLLEIASLQRQAGDLSGALWSLEKAVEGQPRFLPTRVKLGELYTDLGKIDLARQVADDLRRDYPGEPFGAHMAATVDSARGEDEAALASFQEALRRRPSPILAVRTYEAMRAARGDEPALDFLTDWLREHPNDRIAVQALAEALFRVGRTEDARHLYERALKEFPEHPLLLNNLALIHVEQGGADEAIGFARRAYKAMAGAPEAADTLGWVLVRAGQVAEGLKYLREARSRDTQSPGIGYHIGYALDRLGRRDEAREELERVIGTGVPFREREAAIKLRGDLDRDAPQAGDLPSADGRLQAQRGDGGG